MVTPIELAGRKVGPGHPCFVIAEAGVNHNGDITLAKSLIDVAVEAKADAVKFQTFQADRLATPGASKAAYQLRATAPYESQQQMLRRLELSEQAHRELMAYARARGILFLSTPFEEASADLLDRLEVAAFKMASGELTNLPFLAHVAAKGKSMIVSTGMATLAEVAMAVRTIHEAGNHSFALLHCVSQYPAEPAEANLRAIQTLMATFKVPVGYSDHTTGIEVALAAVALGACVIEKHFTVDRQLPGPDHQSSVEPGELAALIRGIRTVEASLGHGRKEPTAREADTAAVARKSLVAARNISRGCTLTEELIAVKRPGTGLPPAMLPQVVGRKASRDIPVDTVLTLEMVSP